MVEKKEVYYNLFNEKAEEFLKEITSNFPDVKQFQIFKTSFNLMKTYDIKKPQQIFHSYVYEEYGDFLLRRDERFFLETNVNITSRRVEYWQEFIQNIRDIWKNLTEEDKQAIWQYFIILVKINEKIIK